MLFHDAVRPLLDHRIITETVAALGRYDAVDVAIPSADTIIVVDEQEEITDVPDRSRIRRGQTPQAFRLSTIRRAYELAWQDPDFTATDDCSVVLRYLPEVPIGVVHGSEQNMKVTHPIDIFLADKLFQLASSAPPPADPDAYQAALAGKSVVVLGGSYGIGADIAELVTGFGGTAHAFSRSTTGTHVERAEDVEAALRTAFEATGRIDYVVVTAGVLRRGPLVDTPIEEIEETIRVNYLAPVVAARAALPYLQQTKGQLMLFTCSSYTRGRADYSIYSSTKAAVVNLTQALADEWAAVRRARQLRQPRAHLHPDAHQGLRCRARGLAAVVQGGGADVDRRADVRPDRARHRRAPRRAGRARDVAHRAGGQPDRCRPRRGGVRPGRPRQRLSRSCREPPGSC